MELASYRINVQILVISFFSRIQTRASCYNSNAANQKDLIYECMVAFVIKNLGYIFLARRVDVRRGVEGRYEVIGMAFQ